MAKVSLGQVLGGTVNTGTTNPNNLPVQSGSSPSCPMFQTPNVLTVNYGASNGGEIDAQNETWYCTHDSGQQLVEDILSLPNTLLAKVVPAYGNWLDSQELGALIPAAIVSLIGWGGVAYLLFSLGDKK